MKAKLAILAGKISKIISKAAGKNGSNLPGAIALKIDPDILRRLSKRVNKIFFITGTNGKTTTSNLINHIFMNSGKKVISNFEGSNMLSGVTSAFINNESFINKTKYEYGVLEIDEASLPKVINHMSPHAIIVTNFFRDQLDRYGEIDLLIDNVCNAIQGLELDLFLNSDDPFAYKLSNLGHRNIFFGLDKDVYPFVKYEHSESKVCPKCSANLKYNSINYGHLGHFNCVCGYSRPKAQFSISKVHDNTKLQFEINDHMYTSNLSGGYNLYNLLPAIALALENDITYNQIKEALLSFYPENGRMEIFNISESKCILNLVKNPAGMNSSLSEINYSLSPIQFIFFLNDSAVDGRDISWIWDIDFEYLLRDKNIIKVICSGSRRYDMALRLKYAGINEDKIVIKNKISDAIDQSLNIKSTVYIYPCYSSLENVRKYLLRKESAYKCN